MSKPWLLVTPASRGIGFHLASHLLKTTSLPLIATARTAPEALKSQLLETTNADPSRLEVLKLDVTDESSISAASTHCTSLYPPKTHHLHLAFLLPGILHPEKSPTAISALDALSTFQINTLGPLLLTKHFLPLLPRKSTSLPSPTGPELATLPPSAVLALMSARVGSISDNRLGGWYSYRASKAGVNSIVKSVDVYLRGSAGGKCRCVGLHPGTVRTGLSREFWGSTPEGKLFEPEWVAERLVGVVRERGGGGGGEVLGLGGEGGPTVRRGGGRRAVVSDSFD